MAGDLRALRVDCSPRDCNCDAIFRSCKGSEEVRMEVALGNSMVETIYCGHIIEYLDVQVRVKLQTVCREWVLPVCLPCTAVAWLCDEEHMRMAQLSPRTLWRSYIAVCQTPGELKR